MKGYTSFDVSEYVLPKYEVTLVEPLKVFSGDSSFPLKVCGRYTYGKPVQGLVQATLCQKAYTYYWRLPDETVPKPRDICRNYTGQTDRTGCFSASVELSQFRPESHDHSHSIGVVATLEEAGTGVEANVTRQMYISDEAGSMNFVDSVNFYHPGYTFRGKLKALEKDGSVLKNHQVYLVINVNNTQTNQSLTTDSSGVATFSLDTTAWNGKGVSLEGRLSLQDPVYVPGKVNQYYQNAYLYLQPYYTTTKSYVKIEQLQGVLPCEQKQEVRVDYSIDDSDLGESTKVEGVIFSYYVTGKGKILLHGQKNVNSKDGGLQGSFSILLSINSDFAPRPSLVVYSLFCDGGVIADKINFEVSMCFKNPVSLAFSQQQELPGASINLELTATPGSLCAVRAVDQSVLLLRSERELSNQTLYEMFSFYGGYPYQVAEYDHCFPEGPFIDPIPLAREKRSFWIPWHDDGVDFFSFLREMGLKVLSNYKIKKPTKCRHHRPYFGNGMLAAAGSRFGAMDSPSLTSSDERILGSRPRLSSSEFQARKNFPETWLWNLYPINGSGVNQVPVTVPDTITEWKANMVCTSPSSDFSISPMVGLIAFKPFFVNLAMPYSVVRGESFPLKASVFNYLKHCIKVRKISSKEYQVQTCKDCEYISCLCADEAKTYSWNVKATKLGMVNFTITTVALNSKELCGNEPVVVPEKGQSDTLIKHLVVRPEGVLVEKSHNSLMCPEGGSTSDSLSLEVPENMVPDSARASVSVVGDIMGTALQNLDHLVQMPSGCGEQNMVLLAPIIYVLQYLESSRQLNENLKTKALGYLQTGYQKELQYKHNDGSYSAFGQSDEQGNTWLTAFVLKCFIQAKRYISIDDQNIQDGLRWMASNQQDNGCFASMGKLFHTAMKGGVDDEISLSAYVTVALLEAKMPLEDPMVKNGLDCLRKTVSSTTDVYTQALLAYVFSMAGDNAIRQLLLAKLDQQAIKSVSLNQKCKLEPSQHENSKWMGGQIYWKRKPAPTASQNPWSEPDSVRVELTSYVLLALVTAETMSQEDRGKATGIVTWLTKQRNAYGGFASTQDTVVALQALAKYAAVTYVRYGDILVTVNSDKGFQQSFHVSETNRLVLQQATLPDIPGKYIVQATGEGCGYVQTVLRYNILPLKNSKTFTLNVTAREKSCEQQTLPRVLNLSISVSYIGNRGTSNMAIIQIKMLSGFHPVQGTKSSLEQQPLVKRVETGEEYLTIYLDQLGEERQKYTVVISQEIPVKNLKPATVKVYDYYEPDEESTVEYSDPCK
ncbi:alpha-2-macroglobulin-like protein 1 [Tiliqua scincoides]|uniref:alpha-2-macroglobulin-like protein 1 n=1 Tax=Tiliqua scincoides TaxID=71010 RepID=UPI0034635FCA